MQEKKQRWSSLLSLFRKLAAGFVFSSLAISLDAAGFAAAAGLLLGQPLHLAEYGVLFFGTFCTYNLYCFYLPSPAQPGLAERIRFAIAWQRWIKAAFRISLVLLLVSLLFLHWQQLLFLSHLAVIAVFYTIALPRADRQKKGFGQRPLRKLPYLKIFLIAYTWTMATTLFPVLPQPLPSAMPALLMARFLFVFAITLPFDLRDLDTDAHSGIKTIAARLGNRRTIAVALCCFALISGTHLWIFSLIQSIPLILNCLVAALLVCLACQPRSVFYFALLDSLMATQFLLLKIAEWLFAGG